MYEVRPKTLSHTHTLLSSSLYCQGELTALSQKHDTVTYFPNVAQYKNIIQYKVKQFYEECVKDVLTEKSYIVDVFISAEKVCIVKVKLITGV